MIKQVICPNGHSFPARFELATLSLQCPQCQASFPTPTVESTNVQDSLLADIPARTLAEAERGLFCVSIALISLLACLAVAGGAVLASLVVSERAAWWLAALWVALFVVAAASLLVGASLYLPLSRRLGGRWVFFLALILAGTSIVVAALSPLFLTFQRFAPMVGAVILLSPLLYFWSLWILIAIAQNLRLPDLAAEGKSIIKDMLCWLIVPPAIVGLVVVGLFTALSAIVATAGVALLIAIVAAGIWLPAVLSALGKFARRFLDPSAFGRQIELCTTLRSVVARRADPAASPDPQLAEATEGPAVAPTRARRAVQLLCTVWGGGANSAQTVPVGLLRWVNHATSHNTMLTRATVVTVPFLLLTAVCSLLALFVSANKGGLSGDRLTLSPEVDSATPTAVPPVRIQEQVVQHIRKDRWILKENNTPLLLRSVADFGKYADRRALVVFGKPLSPHYQWLQWALDNDRSGDPSQRSIYVDVGGDDETRGHLQSIGLVVPSAATAAIFEISTDGTPTGKQTDSTQWGSSQAETVAAVRAFFAG